MDCNNLQNLYFKNKLVIVCSEYETQVITMYGICMHQHVRYMRVSGTLHIT